ncbi:MotA/TolQ/ExbB proton channel family protein [Xanthomonas sp. XNM01]|uniref:MotA/TolQ/ExbB proton channel family protein n=1 Tax=Xanthomonas sp. XNM01 TaxID=2769289 RepID=UPI001782B75F|nr:MotA/TolQ/ExbB proton channel family protein [Xanthomonas sp. XNM01]MBD9367095.1 MotA/TolQ/ExbB proton channel family protein [Xanthomonas sp. XNM01]
MNLIESLLHQLSGWFLAPVLLLIIGLFLYACYALGAFAIEALQRRGGGTHAMERHWQRHGGGLEDLELWILKRLEPLRIGSRTAPMLGLVATMIPMGPALAGLSDGRMDEVARHVGIAFAAVIVSLLAASVIYMVLVVRRRWLLQDLRRIELAIAAQEA